MTSKICNLSFILLCACTACPATVYGGWLSLSFDPAMTNKNAVMMPSSLHSCGAVMSMAANHPKKSRLLAGASSTARFTPAGLSGTLPVDDTRIRELARGLNYNWERCFAFVRNHIAYAPYSGIMKGPERTLLDREGNAADQSLLLCSLLHASGYSNATVVYMPLKSSSAGLESGFIIPIRNINGKTPYNATSWLDSNNIMGRLVMSGLDYEKVGNTHIAIEHYWVALPQEGEIIYLDPSFKPSVARPSQKDILALAGYSREDLLSSASGTVDSISVRNISTDGIASTLKQLVHTLKANFGEEDATLKRFASRENIIEWKDGDGYFFGSFPANSNPIDILSPSCALTLQSLRTPVVLTCNNIVLTTFYLDEVASHTLWGTSDQNNNFVLYVDDNLVATSAGTSSNASDSLLVDVQYRYRSSHTYHLTRGTDKVYVLVVGFGEGSRAGMRMVAQQQLSKLNSDGVAHAQPRMLAASLQLQGHQWLAETAMNMKYRNALTGSDYGVYYNIGIAGVDGAPFVDMANCFFSGIGGYSASNFSGMFIDSALEHSVIEQLNGMSNVAVSTIKVLSLANRAGDPIYYMTSQNVSQVMAMLQNYNATTVETMQYNVNKGYQYLLPRSGAVRLNEWIGSGYVSRGEKDDGTISTAMSISGGMNGGFGTLAIKPNPDISLNLLRYNTASDGNRNESEMEDPVAMPFGAFTDEVEDLRLLRANSLAWGRYYDSRQHNGLSGLGYGWAHNYDANVSYSSNIDNFFGDGGVEPALPTMLAIAINDDLLSEMELAPGIMAQRWTIAALVAQWWTDLIPSSAMSLNVGTKSFSFQKTVDGEYVASPGSTVGLGKDNYGHIFVRERHGKTYKFNLNNLLEEIEDQSGNKTRLTYENELATTNALLVRVENDFDASLSICWNNGLITNIQDNAGRNVTYLYGDNNCLTGVVDVLGRTWRYSYDEMSRLLTEKRNPLGDLLVRNEYNAFSQVSRQISSNGGIWNFGYVDSFEVWDEDPLGNRLVRFFDLNGRTVKQVNRNGAVTTKTYDCRGHNILTITPLGHRSTAIYDSNNNLIYSAEGKGAIDVRPTTYCYDSANRLVAVTNAIGCYVSYEYDLKNRLLATINQDGTAIRNVWNANGTMAESRSYDDNGEILLRKVYEYNAYGLPISCAIYGYSLPASGLWSHTTYNLDGSIASRTDGNGNTSTLVYDKAGHLIEECDPLGNRTTFSYDEAGNMISIRDKMGNVTEYDYTVSGKPTKITYPNGSSVTSTYNELESLTSFTDPLGITTFYRRNEIGLIVETETAFGAIEKCYDLEGNVTNTTDLSGYSVATYYNEESQPTKSVDSMGASASIEYDVLGRRVAAVDEIGRRTQTVFNQVNQAVAAIRPSGAVDMFGYDSMGNRISYTNPEGNVYLTNRDALGRVTSNVNAMGVETLRLEYDANGNIVSSKDADGNMTHFAYDALDRVIRRTTSDEEDMFEYNANGIIISANNSFTSETFDIDEMGRMVSASAIVGPVNVSVNWRYSKGGLPIGLSYGVNGIAVNREFDDQGRLVSLQDNLSRKWRFSYDVSGRVTSITYPNGKEKRYEYEASGALRDWSVSGIASRVISRDLAGRKTSEEITLGTVPTLKSTYVMENKYNCADQLQSSRVMESGKISNVTFEYDGNGNCTSINVRAENVDKQLLSVAHKSSGAIDFVKFGTVTCHFSYDALGNRVKVGDRILIPNFADARKRPLLEYDSNGNFKRAYIWTSNELLGYVDENDQLTIAHTDDQGNVIALSDMDGNVIHTTTFGPDGEDWGGGSDNALPLAWLGSFAVEKIGTLDHVGDLYLTKHRLYVSGLHRFLEPDPIGLAGGLNFYVYAGNNPVGYIDPSGLCSESLDVCRKGSKENPYIINDSWWDRPEGGIYKKGDWVVTGQGMEQLPWDMYMDGEAVKHPGLVLQQLESFKKNPNQNGYRNIKLYFERKGNIDAVQDIYYSPQYSNNMTTLNNIYQASAMVGEVGQTVIPGNGPSWGSKVDDAIVSAIGLVQSGSSIKEYADNVSTRYVSEAHNKQSGYQMRQNQNLRKHRQKQIGKSTESNQRRAKETTSYEEQQRSLEVLQAAALLTKDLILLGPMTTAQELLKKIQAEEAIKKYGEPNTGCTDIDHILDIDG